MKTRKKSKMNSPTIPIDSGTFLLPEPMKGSVVHKNGKMFYRCVLPKGKTPQPIHSFRAGICTPLPDLQLIGRIEANQGISPSCGPRDLSCDHIIGYLMSVINERMPRRTEKESLVFTRDIALRLLEGIQSAAKAGNLPAAVHATWNLAVEWSNWGMGRKWKVDGGRPDSRSATSVGFALTDRPASRGGRQSWGGVAARHREEARSNAEKRLGNGDEWNDIVRDLANKHKKSEATIGKFWLKGLNPHKPGPRRRISKRD